MKGIAVKPTITFHATLSSKASAGAVYAVLSDPNTHLVWAGEQAPMKGFRLLTMESPSGPATVGTQFTSTGAGSKNGSMTFHDQSVVVHAEPGRRFGFDTEARLERAHVKTWFCHFEHRYTIEPASDGSIIAYTCEVYPKNYKPWWLKPLMRPMTRMMVNRTHTKHMRNLSRIAEQVQAGGLGRAQAG
jgi:hypothetical protein